MIALLASILLLTAKPTVIESDLASYDGSEITLKGNVHLEHSFGSLTSENAHITKESSHSKEFQKVHLEKNVMLTLPSGSTLSSDLLDLDAPKRTIELKSIKDSVRFNGVIDNKILVLKSPKMMITLKQESSKKDFQDYIEKIEAFTKVDALYQNLFSLSAGSATYMSDSNSLTFLPKEFELCRVYSPNSSEIFSSKITFDQKQHLITFNEPRGTLTSFLKDAPLSFSSNTLTWEESKNLLTLHDAVEVHYLENTIKNDQEIQLLLNRESKNNGIQKMSSSGTTHLFHEQGFTITCTGLVTIDHEQSCLTMQSDPSSQVTYQDKTGSLKADKVSIDYTQADNKMSLKKITFFGNVSSMNQDEEGKELRYALADLVYYFPETKELNLKAFPGKKVLFFDSIKKIEISADEIQMNQDPETQKEHIKTKGRVRMIFDEKESRLFKQKFDIEKS